MRIKVAAIVSKRSYHLPVVGLVVDSVVVVAVVVVVVSSVNKCIHALYIQLEERHI